MVEKSTAVWLIILTVMVCAAVPGILILLTTGGGSSAKAVAEYFLSRGTYGDLYVWSLF